MKNLIKAKEGFIKYLLMTYIFAQTMLLSVASFAQEQNGQTDINIDINGGGTAAWYTAWWVWIIGIALFIIIIVAIVSAGRRRD